MMHRWKTLLQLFLTMFKIGLFTFGGGYAMIALMEREIVSNKNWLGKDEFLDMIAISESTPGPVAINSATYIGYRLSGVLGSSVATLAVCLPSFIIIYIISLFFDAFIALNFVAAAFKGIQICVVYLILSAGFRLLKSLKKSVMNTVIFIIVGGISVAVSIFGVSVSSIWLILVSGMVGMVALFIRSIKEKQL